MWRLLRSRLTSNARRHPMDLASRFPGQTHAQLLTALRRSPRAVMSSSAFVGVGASHTSARRVGGGVQELVELVEELGGFVGDFFVASDGGPEVPDPSCKIVVFLCHTITLTLSEPLCQAAECPTPTRGVGTSKIRTGRVFSP